MKILSILVCLLVLEFACAAHLHTEAAPTPASIPPVPASIEPIPADAPEPITAPTSVGLTPVVSRPAVEEAKKGEKEKQPEVKKVEKPKAPANEGEKRNEKKAEEKEEEKEEK